MSTTSTVLGFGGSVERRSEDASRPGLLRRAFERWSQARRVREDTHIDAYLKRLGDERLADLGFTPDRIKALRAKGTFDSYWL